MLVISTSQGGVEYRAPIEKVQATLARWHQKAHPTGKHRQRLLTSSEELHKYRKGEIKLSPGRSTVKRKEQP
jgi:hypothetical protein